MKQKYVAKIPKDFNWRTYLNLNEDVKSVNMFNSKEGAEKHWLNHGFFENRQYTIKKTNKNKDNKIVVFTAITRSYDKLNELTNKDDNIDYVCFTDNKINSNSWIIKEIPSFLNSLSDVKKSRCIKLNPHIFLEQYDVSLWVDGNIHPIGEVEEFINNTLIGDCHFYIPKHPQRICIYDEAEAIVRLKKDNQDVVNKQIEKYKNENYPQNFGLCQSGVILRRHNHLDSIKISEEWWYEVLGHSKRDQLSFNYVCWKNQNIKIEYLNPNIISSDYFSYFNHKSKKQITLPKNYGEITNFINGKPV